MGCWRNFLLLPSALGGAGVQRHEDWLAGPFLGASSAGALLGLFRRGRPSNPREFDAGHSHDGPTLLMRLARQLGATLAGPAGSQAAATEPAVVEVPRPRVPEPPELPVAVRKGIATEDEASDLAHPSLLMYVRRSRCVCQTGGGCERTRPSQPLAHTVTSSLPPAAACAGGRHG